MGGGEDTLQSGRAIGGSRLVRFRRPSFGVPTRRRLVMRRVSGIAPVVHATLDWRSVGNGGAAPITLVITSPKRSGSARSHVWLPGTVMS
jgi:hypothetical protein